MSDVPVKVVPPDSRGQAEECHEHSSYRGVVQLRGETTYEDPGTLIRVPGSLSYAEAICA